MFSPRMSLPQLYRLCTASLKEFPSFRVQMICLVTKGSSQLHTMEMTPPAEVADSAKRRHFRFFYIIISRSSFSTILFVLAETCGNRTHPGRFTPHTGFEDQEAHQLLFYLHCKTQDLYTSSPAIFSMSALFASSIEDMIFTEVSSHVMFLLFSNIPFITFPAVEAQDPFSIRPMVLF